MVKYLQSLLDGIAGFFASLFDTITQSLTDLLAWIWDTIVYVAGCIHWFFLDEDKGFIWWIAGRFVDLGGWFVDQLPNFGAIAGEYSSSFRVAMDLMSQGNEFFPVYEACALFGIYLTFMVFFLGCKLILKLIPTIG